MVEASFRVVPRHLCRSRPTDLVVECIKHLSSAPTEMPCFTYHRLWVKAAKASPGCGATHNNAVGSWRYYKARTEPSRPSVQKTNRRQNCTFSRKDRSRQAEGALTWHHYRMETPVGASLKSGRVLYTQSTNFLDVPHRLRTGLPLEDVVSSIMPGDVAFERKLLD